MKKRIYGLETEYGCNWNESLLKLFLSVILRQTDSVERPADRRDGYYLNGARIYRDTGDHPEYSTPECGGIRDLVKWDKAGERIFEEAMLQVNSEQEEGGAFPHDELRLYKNNRDTDTSTFGCHENYLLSSRVTDDRLLRDLLPFLVTRQMICGAGWLSESGFQLSQRARHITDLISRSSTQGRPIIHQKDEHFAEREKWRRLHLILGDANMSQVSGFLKIGTTALVLRMIEEDFFSSPLEILDPVSSLHLLSCDASCRTLIRCLDSRLPRTYSETPAIEIQQFYLERAKEFLAREETAETEWHEVVSRWEAVIAALEEDPMRLYRQIDWVTKKWLMESVLRKYGCSWEDYQSRPDGGEIFEVLRVIDFQYHDIRREFGLYNLLEQEGIIETLVGGAEIEKAMTEPPRDTRANWRASLIRAAQEYGPRGLRVSINDWDDATVTVPKFDGQTVIHDHVAIYRNLKCVDPFKCDPPDLSEFMEKLL